jgi:Zn-dependent peptidase ImmA (M78 family)
MTIKVRYLSEDEIEKEAELLLAEYAETVGAPIKLPVPVDEITIYHLALRLDFADLHETLGIPMLRGQPDILGAIWVHKETVLIDRSLDPKRNPSMSGRYRFSVAHEIGHWRLHRSYVAQDADPASLLDGSSQPTVICRSGQTKAPIEWQADRYASSMLMPKNLVYAMWHRQFQHLRPISLVTLKTKEIEILAAEMIARGGMVCDRKLMDDALVEHVARPFARQFDVSPAAMRIRLEKLGLLLRQVPKQTTQMVGT